MQIFENLFVKDNSNRKNRYLPISRGNMAAARVANFGNLQNALIRHLKARIHIRETPVAGIE
jgi:hypothetical protein